MKSTKKLNSVITKRGVSALLVLALVCSMFSTPFIAFAGQTEYVCGKEEHAHTEECYAADNEISYSCVESLHVHSEGCFGPDGGMICGYADYYVHTHDSLCYNGEVLVCPLSEHELHTHEEGCYESSSTLVCEEAEAEELGHSHGDECYEAAEGFLCGLEEAESHAHTEDCYTACSDSHEHTVECAGCDLSEDAEHVHEDGCYTACTYIHEHSDACIECGVEESEGHAHDENCAPEKQLICELEETDAGHIHGESCYQEASVLSCAQEEVVLHTHVDGCFADGAVICGQIELLGHEHTDECMTASPVQELTCEIEEHTHDDSCVNHEHPSEDGAHVDGEGVTYYCGLEEHDHDDTCLDAESGEYTCGLTYHYHADACLTELESDPSPVYYCSKDEHAHDDLCYDNVGSLSCGIEEHAHTDGCETSDALDNPAYYCGLEAHTHDLDACYDVSGVLMCSETEHVHTDVCESIQPANPTAVDITVNYVDSNGNILQPANTLTVIENEDVDLSVEFGEALNIEGIAYAYSYAYTDTVSELHHLGVRDGALCWSEWGSIWATVDGEADIRVVYEVVPGDTNSLENLPFTVDIGFDTYMRGNYESCPTLDYNVVYYPTDGASVILENFVVTYASTSSFQPHKTYTLEGISDPAAEVSFEISVNTTDIPANIDYSNYMYKITGSFELSDDATAYEFTPSSIMRKNTPSSSTSSSITIGSSVWYSNISFYHSAYYVSDLELPGETITLEIAYASEVEFSDDYFEFQITYAPESAITGEPVIITVPLKDFVRNGETYTVELTNIIGEYVRGETAPIAVVNVSMVKKDNSDLSYDASTFKLSIKPFAVHSYKTYFFETESIVKVASNGAESEVSKIVFNLSAKSDEVPVYAEVGLTSRVEGIYNAVTPVYNITCTHSGGTTIEMPQITAKPTDTWSNTFNYTHRFTDPIDVSQPTTFEISLDQDSIGDIADVTASTYVYIATGTFTLNDEGSAYYFSPSSIKRKESPNSTTMSPMPIESGSYPWYRWVSYTHTADYYTSQLTFEEEVGLDIAFSSETEFMDNSFDFQVSYIAQDGSAGGPVIFSIPVEDFTQTKEIFSTVLTQALGNYTLSDSTTVSVEISMVEDTGSDLPHDPSVFRLVGKGESEDFGKSGYTFLPTSITKINEDGSEVAALEVLFRTTAQPDATPTFVDIGLHSDVNGDYSTATPVYKIKGVHSGGVEINLPSIIATPTGASTQEFSYSYRIPGAVDTAQPATFKISLDESSLGTHVDADLYIYTITGSFEMNADGIAYDFVPEEITRQDNPEDTSATILGIYNSEKWWDNTVYYYHNSYYEGELSFTDYVDLIIAYSSEVEFTDKFIDFKISYTPMSDEDKAPATTIVTVPISTFTQTGETFTTTLESTLGKCIGPTFDEMIVEISMVKDESSDLTHDPSVFRLSSSTMDHSNYGQNGYWFDEESITKISSDGTETEVPAIEFFVSAKAGEIPAFVDIGVNSRVQEAYQLLAPIYNVVCTDGNGAVYELPQIMATPQDSRYAVFGYTYRFPDSFDTSRPVTFEISLDQNFVSEATQGNANISTYVYTITGNFELNEEGSAYFFKPSKIMRKYSADSTTADTVSIGTGADPWYDNIFYYHAAYNYNTQFNFRIHYIDNDTKVEIAAPTTQTFKVFSGTDPASHIQYPSDITYNDKPYKYAEVQQIDSTGAYQSVAFIYNENGILEYRDANWNYTTAVLSDDGYYELYFAYDKVSVFNFTIHYTENNGYTEIADVVTSSLAFTEDGVRQYPEEKFQDLCPDNITNNDQVYKFDAIFVQSQNGEYEELYFVTFSDGGIKFYNTSYKEIQVSSPENDNYNIYFFYNAAIMFNFRVHYLDGYSYADIISPATISTALIDNNRYNTEEMVLDLYQESITSGTSKYGIAEEGILKEDSDGYYIGNPFSVDGGILYLNASGFNAPIKAPVSDDGYYDIYLIYHKENYYSFRFHYIEVGTGEEIATSKTAENRAFQNEGFEQEVYYNRKFYGFIPKTISFRGYGYDYIGTTYQDSASQYNEVIRIFAMKDGLYFESEIGKYDTEIYKASPDESGYYDMYCFYKASGTDEEEYKIRLHYIITGTTEEFLPPVDTTATLSIGEDLVAQLGDLHPEEYGDETYLYQAIDTTVYIATNGQMYTETECNSTPVSISEDGYYEVYLSYARYNYENENFPVRLYFYDAEGNTEIKEPITTKISLAEYRDNRHMISDIFQEYDIINYGEYVWRITGAKMSLGDTKYYSAIIVSDGTLKSDDAEPLPISSDGYYEIYLCYEKSSKLTRDEFPIRFNFINYKNETIAPPQVVTYINNGIEENISSFISAPKKIEAVEGGWYEWSGQYIRSLIGDEHITNTETSISSFFVNEEGQLLYGYDWVGDYDYREHSYYDAGISSDGYYNIYIPYFGVYHEETTFQIRLNFVDYDDPSIIIADPITTMVTFNGNELKGVAQLNEHNAIAVSEGWYFLSNSIAINGTTYRCDDSYSWLASFGGDLQYYRYQSDDFPTMQLTPAEDGYYDFYFLYNLTPETPQIITARMHFVNDETGAPIKYPVIFEFPAWEYNETFNYISYDELLQAATGSYPYYHPLEAQKFYYYGRYDDLSGSVVLDNASEYQSFTYLYLIDGELYFDAEKTIKAYSADGVYDFQLSMSQEYAKHGRKLQVFFYTGDNYIPGTYHPTIKVESGYLSGEKFIVMETQEIPLSYTVFADGSVVQHNEDYFYSTLIGNSITNNASIYIGTPYIRISQMPFDELCPIEHDSTVYILEEDPSISRNSYESFRMRATRQYETGYAEQLKAISIGGKDPMSYYALSFQSTTHNEPVQTELPKTGGPGTHLHYLFGALITAAGIYISMKATKKNRFKAN